jgi:disulfide bond formation protein DsbB
VPPVHHPTVYVRWADTRFLRRRLDACPWPGAARSVLDGCHPTLGGLGVAGYQTYLQLFPATLVARCSASLSYMLDTMAVTEVLARLFHATGDCSDTSFRILGLTLAQASLLIFLSFTLSLVMLLRRQPAST